MGRVTKQDRFDLEIDNQNISVERSATGAMVAEIRETIHVNAGGDICVVCVLYCSITSIS